MQEKQEFLQENAGVLFSILLHKKPRHIKLCRRSRRNRWFFWTSDTATNVCFFFFFFFLHVFILFARFEVQKYICYICFSCLPRQNAIFLQEFYFQFSCIVFNSPAFRILTPFFLLQYKFYIVAKKKDKNFFLPFAY